MRVAALFGLLLTGTLVFGRVTDGRMTRLRALQPFAAICQRLAPAAPPPVIPPARLGRVTMGVMAVRPDPADGGNPEAGP